MKILLAEDDLNLGKLLSVPAKIILKNACIFPDLCYNDVHK
ncbi:hypothetical protein [uncultured Phascolarctobacterium sp.]|nr:hypothetical protein [uncultured Phascolarctobacterium sp.]